MNFKCEILSLDERSRSLTVLFHVEGLTIEELPPISIDLTPWCSTFDNLCTHIRSLFPIGQVERLLATKVNGTEDVLSVARRLVGTTLVGSTPPPIRDVDTVLRVIG